MLENEFNYYIAHQEDLVSKYNGKYLVIVGENVVDVGETQLDAYNKGKEGHSIGTFLIQKCSPGNADYTQTFHSRVSFS